MMIFYATNHIVCDDGCEDQGIDNAIERALSQLAGEAGQAVILTDVVTTVVPRPDNPMKHSIYVTVMAKPYNPEIRGGKTANLLDDVSIQACIEEALTIEGSHHKQWYLWKIADLLGYGLDIDADKGIAP
jgi:hypothetical protein